MSAREDLPYRDCAGIFLTNKDGLVFAGERIDTPGAWQMPQGGIDKGEVPLVAAYRELEEEIGVPKKMVHLLGRTAAPVHYDLPDELLGTVWDGKFRGQRQHWFAMRMLGDDSQINLETEHPEFSAWRWSRCEQLVKDIVPFKRGVYELIVSELGRYARHSE